MYRVENEGHFRAGLIDHPEIAEIRLRMRIDFHRQGNADEA